MILYAVPVELSSGNVCDSCAQVDPAAVDALLLLLLQPVGGGGGVAAPHPSLRCLEAIGGFNYTLERRHS